MCTSPLRAYWVVPGMGPIVCGAPSDVKRRSRDRRSTPLGMRRTRLGPVDVELALGEQPGAVALDECVEIPKGCDHQLALAILGEQMVSQAIALAGCTIAI